jgi:thiamine transport system permease protein
MAKRAVAIGRGPRLPGLIVALLLVALCLGTLLPLLDLSGAALRLTGADWAALRFTLVQAGLSAGLSVMLAIPVARALARQKFRGRSVVIALLGAPFILPVIVAVFGLLAVFGRNGIVNDALGLAGLPTISIYGLQGVVLAHVFLNLPLATRLLLQGWMAIPAERFRLAATLGLPEGRFLERPMLRAAVPGALAVIFLICLTSFAVALTLGGGPRATTLELAIYQSLRFDFDPARAALLAIGQFGLCACVAVMVWAFSPADMFGGGLDRTVQRYGGGRVRGTLDAAIIGLALLFLLLPIGAVVLRGLAGLPRLPPEVWPAALRSLIVALCATGLGVGMALVLALRGGPFAGIAGALPLAASSLVLGTGLLLLVNPMADPAMLALPVTALVNGVMSLPFALRVLQPAVDRVEAVHGRTATMLGLTGWARLRIVMLPRLRAPLGFAAGLTAALSMGDLGVVALFAAPGQPTLPLLMQQLMGTYRMDAAAGVAVLLIGLSFGLFWLFDRKGRADADP